MKIGINTAANNMGLKPLLQAVFLEYVNNYLTEEKFAEHNELTLEQAQAILKVGRECHEELVEDYKRCETARKERERSPGLTADELRTLGAIS